MSLTCSVYGLGLSVNVPLAGLRGLGPARRVDVSMDLGGIPPGRDERDPRVAPFHVSDELDERGTPLRLVTLTRAGDYRIDYADGTRVVVSSDGANVWARGATTEVEDTAIYLLGPVLGFVLRLRGINTLHASAVAIGGRACAFVGASGCGKSSLAAAFARRGHAVLSDDVTPVTEHGGGFVAHPAYPRLRLWPDSVEGLFGNADAMPRIVPGWDKRFLDLADTSFRFQRDPLPLGAIYLLDARGGEPRIEAVAAREALMGIVADTYASYLLDRTRRAKEFEFVGRLLDGVPVRRLRRGGDLRDAARVCDLVAEDVQALAAA